MDPLQAAIVSVKLRHLDAWTAARQANAARYLRLLPSTPGRGAGGEGDLLPSTPGRGAGGEGDLLPSTPGRGAGGEGDLLPSTSGRGAGGEGISVPCAPELRHVYSQFVIRVSRRDELRDHLRACGIGCAVYYPRSLHQQECFAYLGYKTGDFPHSEAAAAETLALPIYPELSHEQMDYVVEKIREFFTGMRDEG